MFKSKKLSLEMRNNVNGLLFALPWIIGFLIFTFYPIVASFYYSFTKYNVATKPKWIGLENYTSIFKDELFLKAFYNTGYYVAGLVPLGLIVGLILALLLVQPLKEKYLYRALIYLPSIVPVYALAVISLVFFNPYFGLVNGFLSIFGANGPMWLSDENWVKFTIVLLSQWGAGGTALIFMAAINDIPKDLYEAAMLDGANGWQTFWKITLPLMSPAILYYLITATIGAVQIFDLPQIMTGGGPANASLSYIMYLYRQGFRYLNIGTASAMAWILFILTIILTILIFKTSARWTFYGGNEK
ncbi:binding-protein-dependent transport systems inner membrane component [Thermoanaerobacter mathranii subsp. mathranii str. A3]|uniref:Binding-protein-dependent transport systems inner membrane component n=2 Tax=Thermoanaerobacter TaxID=1754 RepID=D3T405_THEIA|nr:MULTISPECIES: sugar ABC transporter permease [Thermoanaerobacter]ADD02957.1 binding-protein-dependent transport systems inner membrane component [Thermoanaerobacter italicus Ab9]ADH61405.1 binding-protein-dependent transport systems inner membrane component [Thermoanaerobacter mathranii subsp. mathranii str. A3]